MISDLSAWKPTVLALALACAAGADDATSTMKAEIEWQMAKEQFQDAQLNAESLLAAERARAGGGPSAGVAEAHLLLAEVHTSQKKTDGARQALADACDTLVALEERPYEASDLSAYVAAARLARTAGDRAAHDRMWASVLARAAKAGTESRIEVQIERADSLEDVGELAGAVSALDEVRALQEKGDAKGTGGHALTVIRLASLARGRGDRERARALAREAREIVDGVGKDDHQRRDALDDLAEELAQLEQWDAAVDVAQRAYEASLASVAKDPAIHGRMLAELADLFARTGKKGPALARAREATGLIVLAARAKKLEVYQHLAVERLSGLLRELGDAANADRLRDLVAREMTAALDDKNVRLSFVMNALTVAADAHPERWPAIARQALEASKRAQPDERSHTADALAQLARHESDAAGARPLRRQLLARALGLFEANGTGRSLHAAAVCARMAQLEDDRAVAAKLAERAQEAVRAAPGALWDAKVDARAELAVAFAKLGKPAAAHEHFDEALSLLDRGPADAYVARSGKRLARALADAGETDRAAKAKRILTARFPPER
jgi:hypothetical protein